jgi:hypothetical protein
MQKQQKQTTTEFLNTFVPYCTHALTLQMCLPTLNASEERMERLYERATRTTRQFVRRFAYEAFGNGITRKPNLYHPLIITAIEGTTNTYDKNRTLHAHIALGNVLTPKSKIKTEEQLLSYIETKLLPELQKIIEPKNKKTYFFNGPNSENVNRQKQEVFNEWWEYVYNSDYDAAFKFIVLKCFYCFNLSSTR